jgi:hypothetical protein
VIKRCPNDWPAVRHLNRGEPLLVFQVGKQRFESESQDLAVRNGLCARLPRTTFSCHRLSTLLARARNNEAVRACCAIACTVFSPYESRACDRRESVTATTNEANEALLHAEHDVEGRGMHDPERDI